MCFAWVSYLTWCFCILCTWHSVLSVLMSQWPNHCHLAHTILFFWLWYLSLQLPLYKMFTWYLNLLNSIYIYIYIIYIYIYIYFIGMSHVLALWCPNLHFNSYSCSLFPHFLQLWSYSIFKLSASLLKFHIAWLTISFSFTFTLGFALDFNPLLHLFLLFFLHLPYPSSTIPKI